MLSAFEPPRTAWYSRRVAAELESDGDLLRQIAAGGAAAPLAEREFCRRFAPRIRLYGLRHLKSEDRARDLVQAVLLIVLESARGDRVREPDHVERYVLGTCRHVAQRMKRADFKAMPLPDDDLVRAAGAAPAEPTETGPLFRCLGGLDPRAQAVLMMTYRDDLAADEVAARLDTTAGNVRVLRHRALASLRRCLEGSVT